jgi:hypothetical protein
MRVSAGRVKARGDRRTSLLTLPSRHHRSGGDGRGSGGEIAGGAAPLPGLGSIWSLARAVGTGAAAAVTATAADVVRSVQETDWKSELKAFSAEVTHDAAEASSRAVEAVGHLPDRLEAAAAAAAAATSAAAGEAGADPGTPTKAAAAAAIGNVGASISKLGLTVISGARQVVGQVRRRVAKGGGAD